MSTNLSPEVSIILLNYNGAEDTIACLQSLQETSYPDYNIIIVDNASPDDSVDRIEHYLQSQSRGYTFFRSPNEAMQSPKPQSKFMLLQTGHNGGYGYGNNIGIKYALQHGADYVLVLNNDTVVDPGFLKPMVQICENDKNIGIVSGQIFFYDKPDIFWFNGGKINLRTGKIEHVDYGKLNQGQKPENENTFLTGCLWLVPKRLFKEIGFLNEEYFMYVEDLEFSHRAMQAGYNLMISHKSRIWHKISRTAGGERSDFSVYWTTINTLLFMRKNVPVYYWCFWIYRIIAKFSFRGIMDGRWSLLRAQTKAVIDIFKKRRARESC